MNRCLIIANGHFSITARHPLKHDAALTRTTVRQNYPDRIMPEDGVKRAGTDSGTYRWLKFFKYSATDRVISALKSDIYLRLHSASMLSLSPRSLCIPRSSLASIFR